MFPFYKLPCTVGTRLTSPTSTRFGSPLIARGVDGVGLVYTFTGVPLQIKILLFVKRGLDSIGI